MISPQNISDEATLPLQLPETSKKNLNVHI